MPRPGLAALDEVDDERNQSDSTHKANCQHDHGSVCGSLGLVERRAWGLAFRLRDFIQARSAWFVISTAYGTEGHSLPQNRFVSSPNSDYAVRVTRGKSYALLRNTSLACLGVSVTQSV